MKNLNKILVLIMVLGVCLGASAAPKKSSKNKYSQDLHYISMWGGAGYSGLVNRFSTVEYETGVGESVGINSFDPQFIGGGGGLVGFGYEFHKKLSNGNYFILAVGPEFRLFTSQDNINMILGKYKLNSEIDMKNQFSVQQPDYSTMYQHYDFSRLHETNTIGQMMLPLMVGGQFAENKFFVLAGAKVGWSVFDRWRFNGDLTTSVTEQKAMEDWYDLPNHNLVTDRLQDHPLYNNDARRGTNKFGLFGGLDATVSAEFGINISEFFSADWQSKNEDKPHPWLMRVSAFIDYGIPNLNYNQREGEVFSYSPETNKISNNSLFQSRAALKYNEAQEVIGNQYVNSLLVGVKFTALLQLNKPKQPNPRMNILVVDSFTQRPIPMASVSIQPEKVVHPSGKGKTPKPKPAKKVDKNGNLKPRMAKDTYYINAIESPRYLASDTAVYTLEVEDLYDTIRLAQIPRPLLVSYIHDANTEQIIGGSIEYTSHQSGDLITMSSRADVNSVEISLQYGHTYQLHITAPNYHDTTAVVTNLYDTTHYYLRPIRRVRRTLILKHMYFATDKTNILPASEEDLMTLYNFLVENPKIRVLITGHTDSQGTDTYNQRLSEGRSASVKDEMVKRGIDPERMETDGKGESEPIDTNDTDEGRQNNRRVQVTVLNADEATVDVY